MKHLPGVLTSTFSTDDLRNLAEHPGPFLTVVLPSPSSHDDAAHRLDVRWKNARRRAAAAGWPAERLDEIDASLAAWRHDDAAAFAIVQAIDGALIEETLMHEVVATHVTVDERPRMLTIVESRQRTLPHVVVVTDRAGADIAAFDGGVVTTTDQVEGETLHIHRGHPGGWSQRRYQQRAENTWEDNADSVVDAVVEVAADVQPIIVAVAGDVRARSLVEAGLRERLTIEVVAIDAGDADGIADEVVRAVDDQHARFLRTAIETLRGAAGTDNSAHGDDVLDALQQGQVETLYVHDVDDHDADAAGGDEVGSVDQPIGRLVDRAVSEALQTGADVLVVPNVGELTDGVAASLRW